MMNGYYGMWGGGLLMVLFWLVVIGLAIWGLRALFPDNHSVQIGPGTSPLDIVQLRYSRGEISRDEYLALMEYLKQSKETGK
jgi:putative membrane protein